MTKNTGFIVIFAGLLIGFLVITSKVTAGWGRLLKVDETIRLPGVVGRAEVTVVYDRLEKVNCYIVTYEGRSDNGGVAVDCMKAN